MIAHDELNAQTLRDHVQEIGAAHLPLEAEGYVSSRALLYDVLLQAASSNSSIEAACQELEACVGGNTLRGLLNEQLTGESLPELERQLQAALAAAVPAHFHGLRLEGAIDEHDEPYYGKDPALESFICRGKARAGTTHFWRIATLYVWHGPVRLTLAVVLVRPGQSKADVVERLLELAAPVGLQLGVLYLDRGFCSGAVIDLLQQRKQKALLACPIRGKQGGTRALCRGRGSYTTQYTFSDGTHATLAVKALLVRDPKSGKRKRRWLVYVVIGLSWNAATCYRSYRRRFGIECSYRLARQVRIRSTSRNPALRFFLQGFSLLLVNLWVQVRAWVARLPGPGPRWVAAAHFPLHRFSSLVRRAVERLRGVSLSIPRFATLSKS